MRSRAYSPPRATASAVTVASWPTLATTGADLPGGQVEVLQPDVAEVRRGRDVELDDRDRQGVDRIGAGELDDGDLAGLTGVDDQPGEHGGAGAGDVVAQHDRRVEREARGHLHDHRVGEGVVQHGQRVRRRLGHRAEQVPVGLAHPADAHAGGLDAVGQLDADQPAVDQGDRRRGVERTAPTPPARWPRRR